MTLVKDLLANSTFTAAPGFDGLKPLVSILLPTYRRGDNGLFERAVRSLLSQDFTDFELIIIDDASTDSTAQIIKSIMETDCRVAVIRHTNNIGLPAVSETEGYLKARGQKFFFAFDDNVFTREGLAALVRDQQTHPDHLITYGQVRMYTENGGFTDLGKETISWERLTKDNCVGNAGILADRKVFEEIGLYDPHIALMRVCDWDLWKRAVVKFPFHQINALVSEEWGILQSDFLHNSAPINWPLANVWMQTDRNRRLRPAEILQYAVDDLPGYLGPYLQQKLRQAAAARFGNKFPLTPSHTDDSGYIAVADEFYSASAALVFDVFKTGVAFIKLSDLENNFCQYAAGAKALLFVRTLPSPVIMAQLALWKIPYYYYTDDNLFTIPQYSLVYNPAVTHRFIQKAKEVFASTPALAQSLRERFKLPYQPRLLTCICPQSLQAQYKADFTKFDHTEQIRIAYCSVDKEEGLLRLRSSLEKLYRETKKDIRLFCVGSEQKIRTAFQNSPGISLQFIPNQANYESMLNQMRVFNPHFLIHTHANAYAQIYEYKTFNYFLNAWYLNAVAFITERPPFHLIKNDANVGEFIVPDEESLLKGIKHYLDGGAAAAQNAWKKVDAFWQKTYPIAHNQAVLRGLANENAASFSFNIIQNAQHVSKKIAQKSAYLYQQYPWSGLWTTLLYTFRYYLQGKPNVLRYPVKFNISHLLKTARKTVKWQLKTLLFRPKNLS